MVVTLEIGLELDDYSTDIDLKDQILSTHPWIKLLTPRDDPEGRRYRSKNLERLIEEFGTTEIFPIELTFNSGNTLECIVLREDLFLDQKILGSKIKTEPIRDRRMLYKNAYQALTRQENQQLRPQP